MTDYDPEPDFAGLTDDEAEQYFAYAESEAKAHAPRWFSN